MVFGNLIIKDKIYNISFFVLILMDGNVMKFIFESFIIDRM